MSFLKGSAGDRLRDVERQVTPGGGMVIHAASEPFDLDRYKDDKGKLAIAEKLNVMRKDGFFRSSNGKGNTHEKDGITASILSKDQLKGGAFGTPSPPRDHSRDSGREGH